MTTERWRYPAPGKTKVIHIDADPGVIGATYRTDVALVGDAKLALQAVYAALTGMPKPNGSRMLDAAAIARAKKEKFDAFGALARSDETPIKPERVVATLQELLPRDAVIVCDPGTPCPYFSAYYEFRASGRHFISNRAHGALGYSMSAAVGAHFGRPSAKVLSIMGDGSFGFTAGEMETIVRLKVPMTMVGFSNAVYGWITDHAKVAEAFGVKAWTVRDPADLKSTLAKAIETDGPTLVDVLAQPLQDARAPVSEWVA